MEVIFSCFFLGAALAVGVVTFLAIIGVADLLTNWIGRKRK